MCSISSWASCFDGIESLGRMKVRGCGHCGVRCVREREASRCKLLCWANESHGWTKRARRRDTLRHIRYHLKVARHSASPLRRLSYGVPMEGRGGAHQA
jgi:hypothetical protein